MPEKTRPTSVPSRPKLLWLAGLSAALSMGAHAYLYSQHLDLKFGTMTGKSICDINDAFSCSAIAASRYSELFGIPIALFGFMANAAVLLLLALWPFTDDTKQPAARRNLLLLSIGIAAVSVIMGGISIGALGKFCIFCISAYIFSFIMLGSLWFGFGRPAPSFAKSPVQVRDFLPLGVLALIGFIASMIVNDTLARSSGFERMDITVKGFIQDWQSAPVRQFTPAGSLVKGPPADQARMTIVEFADYRCIHCKHASPVLKAFAAAHPDVRFEFTLWPLDGECNTAVESVNGASCLLGRLVYCAEKDGGRGWAAHEFIFGAPDIYPGVEAVRAAIPDLAKTCALDEEKLRACADSEEAKQALRNMAAVGTGLSLKGTPTFFVDGRQLPGGQVLPVLSAAYATTSPKK